MQQALQTAEAVVLVRPVADPAAAVPILRRRCLESKGRDWLRDDVDWLERWSTDGRDDQLATFIVDNAGESPQQTVERIAAAVSAP